MSGLREGRHEEMMIMLQRAGVCRIGNGATCCFSISCVNVCVCVCCCQQHSDTAHLLWKHTHTTTSCFMFPGCRCNWTLVVCVTVSFIVHVQFRSAQFLFFSSSSFRSVNFIKLNKLCDTWEQHLQWCLYTTKMATAAASVGKINTKTHLHLRFCRRPMNTGNHVSRSFWKRRHNKFQKEHYEINKITDTVFKYRVRL